MEDYQNRRRPNVRIEKVRVTDKNGPQIWTWGKILIKRKYLVNGAIVQSLATILRVAAPVTWKILCWGHFSLSLLFKQSCYEDIFFLSIKWKTTKMEDDLNGRRPKLKTNKMKDDQNVGWPKYKTNKMDNNQNRRQKNGRQPK